MKKKIYEGLYVGSDEACFTQEKPKWAVVHACKHPCHQRAVGYKGSLSSNHPDYLDYEENSHLYLNMVDARNPKYFSKHLFNKSTEFIKKHRDHDKRVLVHCNEGFSRAPSIVLLYLAIEEKVIDAALYSSAKEEFTTKHYPQYNPARGIQIFLKENWRELVSE